MAKTYKNPPVLEAVCEFRFILENQYTEEQVAVFHSQIKGFFPVAKKGKMHQLQFKIEANKTPEENKQSFNQDFHEFEQYISEDEKYSVQLDGGRVAIHRIKPYIAWTDFFPKIQSVYQAYVGTFGPKALMRSGLRYVNEITLPVDGFSFAEYFTIKASLPSLEENSQKSLFLGSIFEQEGGRDAIKVQFTEKQPTEPVNRSFVLDFDYFLVTPNIELAAIDGWLDTAHTNLEKVFEGIVTAKTKSIFDK